MATKKEVATTNKTEVAAAGGFSYGDDAGKGFENKTGADLSIPFLNLLQSNSPEVQKSKDGKIRIGMMKNTVTGEIIDGEEGLYLLPVHDDSAFVEWVPRHRGGGYVGVHAPDSEEVLEAIKRNGGRIPKKGEDGKKIPLSHGSNDLVETYYLYGLVLDSDLETTRGFAVIPFTSTKIKVYRDFITAMMMIKGQPPMFAFRIKITSDIQENDSGTFANYVITPANGEGNWTSCLIDPSSALYAEAKDFRKMVTSGMARADFSQQQNEGAGTGGGSPNGGGGSDDETPF